MGRFLFVTWEYHPPLPERRSGDRRLERVAERAQV